ncbi:recombination regulator RecX [Erwinia tracheiphila]|uniref:Regulatory protein RecX n=1 Tax=Erwinia tracheiphila TaxID=65700 RepID=A0A0M2KAT9_9GAMM|nr:regulatory protein RecX [Erwinia tracheiphila]AXF75302.1 recombination regulator RecX [Erwinia tracheiphila]EOS92722.1 regulatory protein [Erwinia tracheiphila PSU-1]KKF34382.1 RecX family transcriptional regulator [Erwinia tracheiphila]UIA82153.1 recombination regulator RecX [Erwinia tracheiphila]UIA89607.1 recombination regulator RecX [Erwinia tracheiphila]
MPDTKERSVISRLSERAVRILAVRDHSEVELRRKLSLPATLLTASRVPEFDAPSQEQIDQIVAWCYEHCYLDDAHFAERYVASYSRKGYGRQRIRRGLSEKGISQETSNEVLATAEIDWCRKAYEVAERKFGLPLPSLWKERVKVQRYLMMKGYLTEDIHGIYSNFEN